jgi:hypothetical protein
VAANSLQHPLATEPFPQLIGSRYDCIDRQYRDIMTLEFTLYMRDGAFEAGFELLS